MTVGGLRCDGDCGTHLSSSIPYPRDWLRLRISGRRLDQTDDTDVKKVDTVDVCSAKCANKAVTKIFADRAEVVADQSGISQQTGVTTQP